MSGTGGTVGPGDEEYDGLFSSGAAASQPEPSRPAAPTVVPDVVEARSVGGDLASDGGQAKFDSVMDVFSAFKSGTEKMLATRSSGVPDALDLGSWDSYSAADRMYIEEALAKNGIASFNTPRGVMEMLHGFLDVEARRQVLDSEVAVKVAQNQNDLRILETQIESVVEMTKMKGTQAVEKQSLIGDQEKVIENAKLEGQRLQAEVARLEAAKVKREAELKKDLDLGKLEIDAEIAKYKQEKVAQLAAIQTIRTESDMRRERRRAEIYAKKEWVIGISALVVAIIVLICVLVFA